MVLGSSMGVFSGVGPGGGTGSEERTPVGRTPGVAPVVYIGNSDYFRGRLYLEMISSKI